MLVDAARVPVYLATSGADLVANARWVIILSVGAMIGTLFGAPILRRLPERAFRQILSIVLIALGVALIAGLGG